VLILPGHIYISLEESAKGGFFKSWGKIYFLTILSFKGLGIYLIFLSFGQIFSPGG